MSAAEFEEFEELEDLDSLDETSDAFDGVADVDETAADVIAEGATAETSLESEKTEAAPDVTATATSSRFGWLGQMSVYDAMLLTALVTISIACLLMLIELCSFSLTPFSQMYTTEAYVEPLRPPK